MTANPRQAGTCLGVLFCSVFVLADAVARDKVDLIVLTNGDHITGEIVQLEHGLLKLKTDHIGTITIEWPAIVSVESPQSFYVEALDGTRYYGTIKTPGTGMVEISDFGQMRSVAIADVARVAQVEASFWNRLNGSLSVGYDYTKSSEVSIGTVHFDTTYRSREFNWTTSIDLRSTKAPESGTLDRNILQFSYQWLRPGRNFIIGLSSLESNEELGIDGRLQLGLGLGRYVVQTPHSEVAGVAGLSFNQEWITGERDSQQSLEAILGADWRIFVFNTPETSLHSSLLVYPSLTESDRYRTELDLSLRRELIEDFFFDLSFYYSYDNQPPDDAAESSDYGITTSLGYSF